MNLPRIFGLGLIAAFAADTAGAQPARVTIRDPNFRPYPIAVPEAREMSGAPATEPINVVTTTLRGDFELASMFKVLDPAGYIADPKKEGMAAASIKFSDWVSVGAEGLVKAG